MSESELDISNRIAKDDVVIIDINEERFEYPKSQVLKNHAYHLLQEGHTHLVLNLSKVQLMDSFGLAVFISILKECKAKQGNLTMFGLNESVNNLIELTRMDRVLDIWEDESQAVAQIK